MQSYNPLVSIIVPVYHVEKYFSQCVNSLLNQTYRNIEIILVDDGGDDTCPSLCDSYAAQDDRVKSIHKKNEGQSFARRTGFEASQGEYIMYVDSDDWIDAETIEYCVNNIDGAEVVCFGYKRIYNSRVFMTPLFASDRDLSGQYIQRRMVGLVGNELSHVEEADRLVTMWGKLYSRKIASKGVWISEREVCTSEDALYNLFAFSECDVVRYVNKCFYNYRKTDNGTTTRKYRPRMFEQWKLLFHYLDNYIKECDEDFHIALENRIALSPVSLGLNEICNPEGFFVGVRKMKKILQDDEIVHAYQKLEFQYFPIKWKVFFYMCKLKTALPLMFMIIMINKMRALFSE